MKRRPILLAAAIAELLRFFALMTLAQGLGLFRAANGAERLFRYGAAPQLLFAAGFFFLWLDHVRYNAYRPLLIVGKIAGLVVLVPVALLLGDYLKAAQAMLPHPGTVAALVGVIALVDVLSLTLLALSGERDDGPLEAPPGQGPEDIEKVGG